MFNKKEQDLLRALTTSDTALQREDLAELITMLTPDDVKVFRRLGRTRATALTHEWNEASLAASGTWVSGVYADGGIPADTSHTHTRKFNKVMSVGRVAKATGLMNALDLTLNLDGKGLADAFALDFTEKMQDLMRVIEYYILNGDISNTSPQEMDGLLNTVTTNTVDASSGGINQEISATVLKEALKKCYAHGGAPNAIYCRPGVAIKIADLSEGKVQYNVGTGERADLIGGATTFKWLSPFGNVLDVVPIRDEFMPSGKVLILQESDVKLAFLSDGIEVLDLATTTDSMSKLIKAYLTLQHRAEVHSAIITGVADSY